MLVLSEEEVRRILLDDIDSCISGTRNALLSLSSKPTVNTSNSNNNAAKARRGSAIVPSSVALPIRPNGGDTGGKSSTWRDSSNSAAEDDGSGAVAAKDWTLFKTAAYYPPSPPDGPDEFNDSNGTLMGVKVVSIRSQNPSIGKPATPATVLLLDAITGDVQAVLGGTYLTAARTAAGSAIATDFFLSSGIIDTADAEIGDGTIAQHLLVFGAGLQAELHLLTLSRTINRLGSITIVNRSLEKAEQLKRRMVQDYGASLTSSCPDLNPNDDIRCLSLSDEIGVERAVRIADVIVTATRSTTPLFCGEWVKPGCHINSVGSYSKSMEEVDKNFVTERCWTLIDTEEAMKVGELRGLFDVEGENNGNYLGLLGDALCGGVTLPTEQNRHDLDCTFFKSVGTAIEDVFTANGIMKYAEAHNVGTRIEM